MTFVEVLVVLAIIGVLLALLLPALARARASGRKVDCAARMREMGRAFNLYANDNRGFVPRDHTPGRDERRPSWLLLLGPYLIAGDWASAWDDESRATELLRKFPAYQCPDHPLAYQAPATYLVNAFKFESAPIWDPDGPVKLARVRDPARVVLVAETASAFPEVDIMSLRYYDAYRPGHLPRRSGERISDDRHEGTANLLFFDTSARQVRRGAMELEMFDDGVTDRAARPVWDDRGS